MRRLPLLLISLLLLASCGGSEAPVATRTPTGTATRTVTIPPTPTPTNSATPTATSSSTPTPTISATPTPTRTATATETGTVTPTPTITATPSESPSPSITPTATSLPTLEPLEVHADAEWVRDRQERVVLLRGANYSGLEFGNFIGNATGPDESDFVQMASWGFNVIRLPIAWSFIETAPNQFDSRYLVEQVDRVIGFAAQHGILVVPEMHFFQWSPCFTGGNGAPAWVCDGHTYSDDVAGQYQAQCDFFLGATAPDGRPLMDHFVDLWSFVARHYAGDTRLAGLDYFNEPTTFACIPIFDFEPQYLNPFYRRIRAAVQAEGAQQAFFYTPSIIRNRGFRVQLEAMGPNVAYAPHLYTETGGAPDIKYDGDARKVAADYTQAAGEAPVLGGPLFAGEFGGNTDEAGGFRAATEQFLRDSLAEQDRHLVGGAVWAYFPSDNTFSIVDAQGGEKGDLVNIVARPYARRIAGIPTMMQFDLGTKEFIFSFRTDAEHLPPDPTEIFVPAARHYPSGFTVEVTPGDVWTFDAASGQLLLFRGEAEEHTIHIRPS